MRTTTLSCVTLPKVRIVTNRLSFSRFRLESADREIEENCSNPEQH